MILSELEQAVLRWASYRYTPYWEDICDNWDNPKLVRKAARTLIARGLLELKPHSILKSREYLSPTARGRQVYQELP